VGVVEWGTFCATTVRPLPRPSLIREEGEDALCHM
jgi:hypothetical protein